MTEATGREDDAAFLALQARAEGTNINVQTLLATDYLNHFNEIVMMLEMIPDMAECYDEALEWKPKSYPDHFRDSQFRDRLLAIELYDHVPKRYREPFDDVVSHMNALVALSLEKIGHELEGGTEEALRHYCADASHNLQRLMDVASAVIHGSTKVLVQSEIDGFLSN